MIPSSASSLATSPHLVIYTFDCCHTDYLSDTLSADGPMRIRFRMLGSASPIRLSHLGKQAGLILRFWSWSVLDFEESAETVG